MQNAGNIIRKLLIDRNLNQIYLSEKLGTSVQNLNKKLKRGNFDTDDFFKMLDILNYDIEIVEKKQSK